MELQQLPGRINQIYYEILGRLPDTQELQSGMDLSRKGITETRFRNMIANTEEARIILESILRKQMGQVHPESFAFWHRSLAEFGAEMRDIENQIKIWKA